MKENIKPDISVAPMMDWTDRHCRYFLRLISPNAGLYTEMVTTGALIHGDRDRFLRFNKAEHPITLQLGGECPDALSECAKIGEDYGYDEININCGCPSDRVQKGNFGACLMENPILVAECVSAMSNTVNIPVTIKCRIAIDNYEEEPFLDEFIKTTSEAGCKKFIIHARKAYLQGLNPKENREIPPLRYDIVEKMKNKYSDLKIILNGGIGTIDEIKENLNIFDGVMLGRNAYKTPYFLAKIEKEVFGNEVVSSREEVARKMIPYINQQMKEFDVPAKSITRHMLGLFQGKPGAKLWRRYLSEEAIKSDTDSSVIENALLSGPCAANI
jgi:tRNA-dihydrouridine synthase A